MGSKRSRSASISSSSSLASSASRSPSPRPSSSKVALGPALPPGFSTAGPTSNAGAEGLEEDDDDNDYLIGPAPPPDGAQGDPSSASIGEGARAFLEREERRRQAEVDAEAAKATAASSRPEWMLVPPTASSLSTILSDPKRALKSRGFQQNTRVQARGSLPSGSADPDGMSAWTETPEQRAQRLKDEVEGRRPRLDQGGLSQDDALKAEAQRRKDAATSAKIREIDPSRSTSLLDLHRQKRADELSSKSKDKHGERDEHSRSKSRSDDKDRERDRSSKRRHRHDSDSEDDASRRHRSSRDRRDKGHSDDEKDEERRRERRRRERHRDRDKDRDRSDRYHSSSSKRHSHSRRSRSPSQSSTDSEYERERQERKRRKREKKRKLEEEAEAKKQAGATGFSKTMIWDREKVMGVGARALDEKGKAQAIRDAVGLRDRFAGGSSGRFL